MNIEEYRAYCLSKKGVTESFPFSKLPDILVFKVMDKMFTATNISTFESISTKCHPDNIDELRAIHDEVGTQAYMHKRHWNSIQMQGSLSDNLIKLWIDTSYELIVNNLSKEERNQLALA